MATIGTEVTTATIDAIDSGTDGGYNGQVIWRAGDLARETRALQVIGFGTLWVFAVVGSLWACRRLDRLRSRRTQRSLAEAGSSTNVLKIAQARAVAPPEPIQTPDKTAA